MDCSSDGRRSIGIENTQMELDLDPINIPPSLPPATLYSPRSSTYSTTLTAHNDCYASSLSPTSTINHAFTTSTDLISLNPDASNQPLYHQSSSLLQIASPRPTNTLSSPVFSRVQNNQNLNFLSSYPKPKLSNIPDAISNESYVVIIRCILSISTNTLSTLFTDHKARSLALRSSPFAKAGISDLRINKQKMCLAIVLNDISKLPALNTIKKLGHWDITCSPPLRETCISAVIRRVPLDLTDEEILSELQVEHTHVNASTRLFRRDKDSHSLIKTGSIKIDFSLANGSTLPDRVSLYYEIFTCELFVRNPLRCTKCQSFGHTTSSCRSKQVKCAKCSGSHNIDSCTVEIECCPNCKGSHPAYSRLCPKYSHARNIETVSAINRISYSDAVKKINSNSAVSSLPETNLLNNQSTLPNISSRPIPISSELPSSTISSIPSFAQPTVSIVQAPMQPTPNPTSSTFTNDFTLQSDTYPTIPTLSDICPPLDLKQFILDIHNLFQRKLKEKSLQSALLQLVNNFLAPRVQRTTSSASSTKSPAIASPKRKKNKKS